MRNYLPQTVDKEANIYVEYDQCRILVRVLPIDQEGDNGKQIADETKRHSPCIKFVYLSMFIVCVEWIFALNTTTFNICPRGVLCCYRIA